MSWYEMTHFFHIFVVKDLANVDKQLNYSEILAGSYIKDLAFNLLKL